MQHLIRSSAELYMPTKKRRVGFIPRSKVLEIIDKLSFESNLSNSKIISILVEEALFKRGMLTLMETKDYRKNSGFSNNKFMRNAIATPLLDREDNSDEKAKISPFDENYCSIDPEIYKKFIMFLKFQDKLKESGFK